MTPHDAMKSGTKALMMAIGRQITETLMALPEPTPLGVCARFEPKPPLSFGTQEENRPSYAGTDYCVGFEPQADF